MTTRAPESSAELVVTRGGDRRTIRESVTETLASRDLIGAMAFRAIKLRYRQALVGFVWAVAQPAAYLVVFTLIFGQAIAVGSGGDVPYAAFSISAIVTFQLASNGVGLGAMALVSEMPLLRRVYFCREAPVLAAVTVAFADFLIGVVLMLVVGPFLGAHEGWHLIFLPLCVLPIIVFVYALSLIAGGLNVYFRDIRFIMPLATQLWMFASPVAFPITQVSEDLRPWYAIVNPIVGPLEGVRRCVALGQMPDWELLGLSSAATLVLLLVALVFFNRIEGGIADAI
jgi:ABC-type polysaccharide/polyol phosphate export permease